MRTPLPKISAPAQRALSAQGITCLDELVKYSEKEVSSLHGMGNKAMTILREALDDAGLKYAN
jgi:DNA-directed RNA polymerase alpha subunit